VIWWLLAGLWAALLALALGYGLVASALLVSFLGMDPRDVVPTVLLSQLLLALPLVLTPRRPKINFVLKVFLTLTTVLSMALPSLLKGLGSREMVALYSATLAGVVLLYIFRKRIRLRMRYWVGLFSLLAALDKAIIGGGLSAVFVAMQAMMGIDVRDALMALPVLKAIPVAGTLAGYLIAGMWPSFEASALMTLGALIGTFIARKTVKKIKPDERAVLAFLILSSLAALIRNSY